jgi:hypothetical protein
LSKGSMRVGDSEGGYITNEALSKVTAPIVYGMPDLDGMCLYNFYGVTLNLLMNGVTASPKIENYYRLPMVAGDLSYRFSFGPFAETARCPKHGEYLRAIGAAQLKKVVEWCRSSEPMQVKAALEQVYGSMGGRWEEGEVRIYNPEGLPLKSILEMQKHDLPVLSYDTIEIGDITVWLPYYYSIKESLIADCPKCTKLSGNRRNAGGRR